MKIKRFFAKDMRTALNDVKEQLGVEAIIMSNKKVSGGIEIVAAIDNDAPVNNPPQNTQHIPEHSPQEMAPAVRPKMQEYQQPAFEQHADEESVADSLEALLSRQKSLIKDPKLMGIAANAQKNVRKKELARQQANQRNSQNMNYTPEKSDFSQNVQRKAPVAKAEPVVDNTKFNVEMSSMKEEISSLRKLLEHQVSGLMWQELERKEPLRAMLIKRLRLLGICDEVADQLACFIPEYLPEHDAWPSVLEMLEGQITTTKNDILHKGGVVALVGPTGVGKTTTIAKLAAQFAKMHGAETIGLITTDTFRIGAHEQLATYGKIMGNSVKVAKDENELTQLLLQMKHKKLVLIDTAGLSQRDFRLTEQLDTLIANTNMKISSYLVLSATSQRRVLEESIAHFKRIPLSGCIFTKVDESLSLGEIISVAIQNALPIAYLTDGQRVPEDIKVASAKKLIADAEQLLDAQSDSDHVWFSETESQAVGMYE